MPSFSFHAHCCSAEVESDELTVHVPAVLLVNSTTNRLMLIRRIKLSNIRLSKTGVINLRVGVFMCFF